MFGSLPIRERPQVLVNAVQGSDDAATWDKNFDRLLSAVEFVLFGMGGGAERMEQVWDLWCKDMIWGNFRSQDLYFPNLSNKQATTQGRYNQQFELLKLPRLLSRYMILFRRVAWNHQRPVLVSNNINLTQEEVFFIPRFDRNERKHWMTTTAEEVFEIDITIPTIVVRHFWTSLLNVLMSRKDT